MKYAVVIEKAKKNYSAYAPDLPGCIAAGDTLEETKQLMQEAMEFHIESMLLDGDPTPERPTTQCCYVEIDMAKVRKAVRKQSENPHSRVGGQTRKMEMT